MGPGAPGSARMLKDVTRWVAWGPARVDLPAFEASPSRTSRSLSVAPGADGGVSMGGMGKLVCPCSSKTPQGDEGHTGKLLLAHATLSRLVSSPDGVQ